MRRLGIALLALLALLVGSVPVASAGAPRISRLLVYAQEWRMWSSSASVLAGEVYVQLWNRGEDPHDLRVQPVGRARAANVAGGVAKTPSGGFGEAAFRLSPGRYVLYCSLPQHRLLGMHTLLLVR